ncbi:cytochrome C oxidase subunit IV family protein [Ichthyenterobacterium magnum]|uniref:Cytochrome c oxidase subunit IV n=1 Tax=Ichthyenterobacterium magnum TaxID=1230530 RepID=A0A420DV18_9FLAO|nr:cytochrome C oxidase subunit IV family protein [Ichthyenterobacterium magnum]RKE98164.1 cytochrome c oxidase subunit IV [Ichthyenterobacterium magnum]
MKTTISLTWLILIVLTITSAYISNLQGTYIAFVILILAALKFLGIAFQFMELKKAHVFWKGIIIGFVVIFIGIISVVI